eukprot:2434187-Amphidinium_carterae.1
MEFKFHGQSSKRNSKATSLRLETKLMLSCSLCKFCGKGRLLLLPLELVLLLDCLYSRMFVRQSQYK